MKKQMLAAALVALLAAPAFAQNIAVVNGKPVPTARLNALKAQIEKSGRPVTDEMLGQLKDEVIAREIFMQEARKRGLDASDEYKNQLELARQTILIRELFADFQKKNPVTDVEIQGEYDKFVAANGGKEYHARHILVETEDQAKALIADIQKTASSKIWPRSTPRTRAPAPTVATWTGPAPAAMWPSSPTPWSSWSKAK